MLKDSSMNIDRKSVVASAVRTLETERAGLKELAEALDNGLADPFAEAVRIIAGIKGRLIVTGVGKSGHIGSKIAATLASTGTPAFFVHPAEANHGDLGMIGDDDVILAMSWSGETTELHGIVAYARRFAIPIIAITAGKSSALGTGGHGRSRDCRVRPKPARTGSRLPRRRFCSWSSAMRWRVALLEARGFTADHFRTFHPGGQLGAKLTQVRQIMHSGSELPLASSGALMREAILEMTQKGFGCVGITDADGVLIGIITDGDLRRHIDSELLSMTVDQVMTRNPKTIGPETLAESALQVVNSSAITTLMVVEDGKPCGVVHLHDLLRIGAA